MKRIILIFIAVLFLKGPAVPLVIAIFSNTQIGQISLFFQDKSRDRLLINEIWYPTRDTLKSQDKIASPFKGLFTVRDGASNSEKLPLIMMSHGTGGIWMSLERLAQALVRQGYIVATVDHWGNIHAKVQEICVYFFNKTIK